MNKLAKDLFFLTPEKEIPGVRGQSPSPYIPPSYGASPEAAMNEKSRAEISNRARINRGQIPFDVKPTLSGGLPSSMIASPAITGVRSELRRQLNQLAGLIANVTEAYSVVVFLVAEGSGRTLAVEGVHTLSREFVHDAEISFGSGLVGWTAENKVRISVCPFEHDATTLRYYHSDQGLKSFIALPILDENQELLGVISCDSKKSYAFAKITEKILIDCAAQAATIIQLVRKAHRKQERAKEIGTESFDRLITSLRMLDTEDALLSATSKIPNDIVARDALVVMTTEEGGVGAGTFYSSSVEQRVEHRLLDLVCQHKKIICKDRSVHALPVDDIKHRSFLSIPFQVMDKEAGSLNLLSPPSQGFRTCEIAALEQIASIVGRELERIRLRERFSTQAEQSGHLSWKHFQIRGKARLMDAKSRRIPMTFLRLQFSNIAQVEEFAGVEVAAAALHSIVRLVDQIARPPAISCCIYGTTILILCESNEAERLLLRIRRLVERIGSTEFLPNDRTPSIEVGELLSQGMMTAVAHYPANGESISLLNNSCRSQLQSQDSGIVKEGSGGRAEPALRKAGNW